MLLEALRTALAAFFLVILPGLLLSYALFPKSSDLKSSERTYLAIAGGMLLLMSVALVLGFLPHAGRGALQSSAIQGMPNVELGMIGVTVGLGWVALRRGALPRLAALLPTGWRGRATPRPQGQAR